MCDANDVCRLSQGIDGNRCRTTSESPVREPAIAWF